MARLTTRLSAKGLSHILFRESDNDFEFIVGGCHYFCNHVIAAFLSPRIAELQSSDSTSASYRVLTDDQCSYFKSFLSLAYGEEIEISHSNQQFLSDLSVELGNSELVSLIEREFIGSEITESNVISRLHRQMSTGGSYDIELAFVASHFEELSKSLAGVELWILEAVLADERLCIESEDSLFDFIVGLGLDKSFSLMEFVRLEQLSIERVRLVVKVIVDGNISVNFGILKSLCSRVVLPVDASGLSADGSRYRDKFPFKAESPLSGIISYLTQKNGGNVHDKGIVGVSCSSVYSNSFLAKYVADVGADTYWHSKNEDNSWLCYDFKNMRVRPSHYSLRSRSDGCVNSSHLRSWYLETSIDGTNWVVVDHHRNYSELNGRDVIRTFAVKPCEYCRFVRIRHQGPSWSNFYVAISSFEVFGDLQE
jgi:hypothetical protein